MKRFVVSAAVLALVAVPSAALAGGSEQGTSINCGTIMVNPAKPQYGLTKQGAYNLGSFNKQGKTPLACSKVKAYAKAYVAHGTVPKGYVKKGYSVMIGRNFYAQGTGTNEGFQILWTKG